MNRATLLFFAALLAAQTSWAASDQRFVDFLLKNVHERGFNKCDTAIKEIFNPIGGEDIRVITQTGLFPDSIKVIAVYGAPSDAVYVEAEIRHAGGKCAFTRTTTIISSKSCAAELASNYAFKYEADTVGVTFAKNAGGVNMLLIPQGSGGCTKIYLRDGKL